MVVLVSFRLSHHQPRSKQIDEDMWHLWCAGRVCGSTYMAQYLPWSPFHQMGGTPLNNALMIVPELIKQFRQKTGAQKVSFVCITDGESAPLATYKKQIGYSDDEYIKVNYPYYETVMVRSGASVFPISGRNTGDCVNWLKTQLDDVFISNIFLGKRAKSSHHLVSYGATLMRLCSARMALMSHHPTHGPSLVSSTPTTSLIPLTRLLWRQVSPKPRLSQHSIRCSRLNPHLV